MKKRVVKIVKQIMYLTLVLALIMTTMPVQTYVYAREEVQQDSSDNDDGVSGQDDNSDDNDGDDNDSSDNQDADDNDSSDNQDADDNDSSDNQDADDNDSSDNQGADDNDSSNDQNADDDDSSSDQNADDIDSDSTDAVDSADDAATDVADEDMTDIQTDVDDIMLLSASGTDVEISLDDKGSDYNSEHSEYNIKYKVKFENVTDWLDSTGNSEDKVKYRVEIKKGSNIVWSIDKDDKEFDVACKVEEAGTYKIYAIFEYDGNEKFSTNEEVEAVKFDVPSDISAAFSEDNEQLKFEITCPKSSNENINTALNGAEIELQADIEDTDETICFPEDFSGALHIDSTDDNIIYTYTILKESIETIIDNDTTDEKYQFLEKVYKNSFKVKAVLHDRTQVLQDKEITSDSISLNKFELTLSRSNCIRTMPFSGVLLKETVASWQIEDVHGAETRLEECDSNGQATANKLFGGNDGETLYPENIGETYVKIIYSPTVFFKQAEYIAHVKIEPIAIQNPVFDCAQTTGSADSKIVITVSYPKYTEANCPNYENVNEAIKNSPIQLVAYKDNVANGLEITTFDYFEQSISETEQEVVFTYTMNKEKLDSIVSSEADWEKLKKLYDQKFLLQAVLGKNENNAILENKSDSLLPYQLTYEVCPVGFEVTGIQQHSLNLEATGKKKTYRIVANSFWQILGYKYDFEIIERDGESVTAVENKRNQSIDITMEKTGTTIIKVKVPKQFFFDEKVLTLAIQVDSPDVSDDLMRFSQIEGSYQNKTWNQFTEINGSVYGNDQDGYWSRYPLMLSMDSSNLYYNKFYIDGIIDAQNAVSTYELENSSMTDYLIRVKNDNLGTLNSVSYKVGIDRNGPERKTDITTIEAPANYDQGVHYYNTNPTINIAYEDRQSGVAKITLTKKKTGEAEETVDFTEPVVLEDAIYDYIYFTGIDNVGNETRTYLCRGDIGEKIVVDTTTPTVTAIMKVSENDYCGEWTNQQIQYVISEVSGRECLSGIKTVKYAYVPYGKSYDDIQNDDWIEIEPGNDGKYCETIGESNWPGTSLAPNAIASDTVDGTAVIGTSPHDENGNGNTSSRRSGNGTLKNGTYYFKATSNALLTSKREDIESNGKRVKLHQRQLESGTCYVTAEPASTGWYNATMIDNKPYLSVAYPDIQRISGTLEYPSMVTLHFSIKETYNNDIDFTQEFTAGCKEINGGVEDFSVQATSGYTLEEDGTYEIYVWTTDEAGNRSETKKYIANADYTPPADLEICVNGDDITEEVGGTIQYNNFFQSSVDISVSANFDLSGYKSLEVYEAKKPGDVKKSGSGSHSIGGSEGSFSVSPNKRCYFHMIAVDQAGNESEVRSQGIVVDNESPIGMNETEFTIEPIGANKNGFFNKDFNVDIKVQDSPTSDDCAALKEVTYMISDSADHSKTEQIFSFGKSSPSFDELSGAEKFEDTVTITAKDYESNTAYIEVTSIDNAGNERKSQKELQIDVTLPEITVTYDNNNALHESYYQQNRTAKVNIHELNFDPADVEFEITKDGMPYTSLIPGVSSWQADGDDHYVYITFAEDGDYTLTLSYIDLADNEAVYDQVDSFTIDKTKPSVTVNYDNETPWKDFYFNTARTATITIVEHNFDPTDFSLTSVPAVAIGGWTHDGDTHKTTIAFREDGEYTYSFDYLDLAGNAMDKIPEEHFKIDTVDPIVTIEGVEDQSANAGEVIPVVTVQDEDFDAEGIEITLRTSLGAAVNLKKSASAIENGYRYTLPNVTEQEDAVYYLTVAGTDLAGNTSELTYRFSLNRHGSSYDLSNLSYLVDKVYTRYDDISDLEIMEMNIDTIDKFSIYISRNGTMLGSKEAGSKPSGDDDTIYYSVKESGNADIGYTYTYTLYQENFEKEGLYNIMFYSKDRAGNEVNNTLTEKGADISFVIDNTAPNVLIEGVEGNALYVEDSLDVNVVARDNFKLKKAEFYLLDRGGNRIQTWDYLKQAGNEDTVLTLTLPSSEERQSLLFYAIDEAGNEIVALQDDEDTPTSFLITTNPWLRFVNSTKDKVIVSAVAGSIICITGVTVFLRRRKKIKIVSEVNS